MKSKSKFNILFKKTKEQPTIEFIEKQSGIKLTYPNIYVEGNMDEERYKELKKFGCSDIWDTEGHWLHRDCFSGRYKGYCQTCNFYPIVEEYNQKNNIPDGIETDFTKAEFWTKFLK